MFRISLCALLLAAAPFAALAQDELSEAFKSLKAADEQKDNDQVKKSAVECINLANDVLKTPKPTGESELKNWTTAQEYSKQVKEFAEYAIDAAMLRTTEPEKQIELYETLEKASPESKYLQQLNGIALADYAKMKPDKSYAFAQRAIARDPNNEDLLLVLASGALERKQYDAAASFGVRAGKAGKSGAKAGRGYYVAGMAYQAQNKHPQAIENLKACLPLLKGEPQLTGQAEFYIGLASYQLASITHEKPTMQEALKYSELAAASGASISKNAAQNVYAIKQELAKMR